MYAYLGKILAEATFHKLLRTAIHGAASAGGEYVAHDTGSGFAAGVAAAAFFALGFFLLAGGAFALYVAYGCEGHALHNGGVALLHAHHLVGYRIGFLLVGVAGGVDGELGLEEGACGLICL
jgi:hypothetical protein